MNNTDQPANIPQPWANLGGRSVIPNASQIGTTDGAASWPDGYPPLTRTPPDAGGIPPNGLEMNGVLFSISAAVQWTQAGGQAKFNSGFASLIGGYPSGAVVQSSDNAGWWRCTTDANSTNPDAGGANWVPIYGYGASSITLAGSSVTLTALQALRPQIVVTGTLTNNVNLIFPASLQEWLVLNNTSGAYTITAKTSAGTGVPLNPGPNKIFGDGSNIQNEMGPYALLTMFSGANRSLASSGYQFLPAPAGAQRLVFMWTSVAIGDTAPSTGTTTAFSYPLPPGVSALSAVLSISATTKGDSRSAKVDARNVGLSGAEIYSNEWESYTQNAVAQVLIIGVV